MNDLPLFVFGTLCHAPLRAAVLGPEAGAAVAARLHGYASHWVAGADYPMLVAGDGAAEGLLIEGNGAEAQARADFFELGFGYELRPVTVAVEGRGAVAAQAYFLIGTPPEAGARWDLEAWVTDWAEIWLRAAREAAGYFGQITADELARRWGMIKLRAAASLRATTPAPHSLRSGMSVAADVEVLRADRPYSNYFTVEEHDLRFRRFDGTMSAPVTRAGFVMGDAAAVLPYDPVNDTVLLVEQFRIAPYLRGAPQPWSLEPIAGRVDPGEDPETCVRREAVEEAGLTLGALYKVAQYYPSPGAVTEFLYSYVGIADLSGRGGEVNGVDSEDEDIRAHVVGFDRLMALIETGEIDTGPLILCAHWLAQNRDRLRQDA